VPWTRLLREPSLRLLPIYAALSGLTTLVLLAYIHYTTVPGLGAPAALACEAESRDLVREYRLRGQAALLGMIEEGAAASGGRSVYLLADRSGAPIAGGLERWPGSAPPVEGELAFDRDGDPNRPVVARVRLLEGGVALLVGREVSEARRTREMIVGAIRRGALIAFVLTLFAGALMSRRVMTKIRDVNRTVREMLAREGTAMAREGGDDLDDLSRSAGELIDTTSRLAASLRSVSDNIAHDLRTPLTRLKNHLEMLRARVPEDLVEPVEQGLAEADALLSTFNALLRIAQIESGTARVSFSEVDLVSLVRDVTDLYEPLAEEKNQRLETLVLEDARAWGNRDLLFQMLANIVDNAVKYAPTGGRVRVVMRRRRDATDILVEDDGPGIPAPARALVFQRFFRLDESRSTPGSGLGLSLVAAVARLHGIDVTLEDNEPGLRVVLALPTQQTMPENQPDAE
jgi:signal transduction histidine kinase